MSSYLSELIQFLVGYAGDYQLNHWMNKSMYVYIIYSGVREKRKEREEGRNTGNWECKRCEEPIR